MTKPTQETLREAVAPGQPKSSIDLHQRRGIMSDSILAALEEYRGYMLDDDYNAAGCLDRVVKHLERARPVAEQLEESALSLMQPEIDRRVADERANLESKFRCVVSHATGGSFQDIDASLNEISVRISQFRTQLWERAKQSGAKEERAKLLERLRDDLNIAIELIQEAKGYEGPKGGPITYHLDAAEGWIDRVLAQFEKENSDG